VGDTPRTNIPPADIPPNGSTKHDQQSRLKSIYRIFELVDLFLADVVLHSANKFGNQNIKESAINSTSPTNQYPPIILDYTMT
jgi:hypothetical protein